MVLQLIQDDLLSEEIEAHNACEANQIPIPFQRLQKFISETPETSLNDSSLSLKIATAFCMRDLYHHARVQGFHALENVMDTALSLIQRDQIQDVSQVCLVFFW